MSSYNFLHTRMAITMNHKAFDNRWWRHRDVNIANGTSRWCVKFVSLKAKDRQIDNFVVTSGTVSCHYDNLWYKVVKLTTFFQC